MQKKLSDNHPQPRRPNTLPLASSSAVGIPTRQGMTAHYSVVQIDELVEALNRITDEGSRINRSLAMIRREAASCWKPDEYWARAIIAVRKALASIS